MNRKLSALVIATIIFFSVFIFHIEIGYSSVNDYPRVSIARAVQINEWGATLIYDNITFIDLGDTGTSSFRYGFPLPYKENLVLVKIMSEEGEDIDYNLEVDDKYVWISFSLDTITSRKGYRYNLTQVFSERINYGENRYTFSFFDTPIFPYQVDSCNVTFLFPADASLTIPENLTFTETMSRGFPAFTTLYEPLQPYHSVDFSIQYTSISSQLIKIVKAKREIRLTTSGILHISDSYHLKNLGTLQSAIPIDIMKGAENVWAYDIGGKIWVTPQEGVRMTLTPRHGALQSNETFIFTLKYQVPTDLYIERKTWNGLYLFTFDIITPQPWIIDELEVEVILPKGADIKIVNTGTFPQTIKDEAYQVVIRWNLLGVTPFHDLTQTLEYNLHPVWIAFKPVIWLLIVGVSVATLYAMTFEKKKKEEEEPVARAPKDIVARFLDFQEEKVILNTEYGDIIKKFSRGGISRKEFQRKRKAIERRIAQIDRRLSSSKSELRSTHPRYGEILNTIEKSETEIITVRSSIRQLFGQYRAGKISRETYERIIIELEKRMSKAKGKLERTLISMKEEIR